MNGKIADACRAALLAWFDAHKRDLPWRRTQDPYRIWLSEIMLQQTRVETVIPYFERFLSLFPDVHALAAAPRDSVLAAWAGLGYYRRARMLHEAAVQLSACERFPDNAKSLREVHGIGPYTAGAVASIAFGEVTPLVDGNVIRVLSRWFDLSDDMRTGPAQKKVWALAADLVDAERPGDWNQALMELGARTCTPSSPSCAACPVRASCQAYAHDTVAERPKLKPKAAPKREALNAYVLIDGDGVWLSRRREHLRYGGLWEPPTHLRSLSESWGNAGEIRHVLTHRELVVTVWVGEVAAGCSLEHDLEIYDQRCLVGPQSFSDRAFAVSTLAKKVLAVAGIDARARAKRNHGLNEDKAVH